MMRKLYPLSLLLVFTLSCFTGTAQRVAAGRTFAFVVCNDSTVWAWGQNTWGNLGDNTTTQRNKPVQVHGPNNIGFLTGVVSVVGSEYSALALKGDGTVWAWGDNHYGQLGDSTLTTRTTPVQVHGPNNVGFLADIVAIAGIGHHFIALKKDSTVWAWGNNGYGQLGINSNAGGLNGPGSMVPVQVMGPNAAGFLTGITAIAANYGGNIALKADGTVWTWGENGNGQIGDGTQTQRLTPVQVHGTGNVGFLTDVVAVTAGNDNCLALKKDSTLWSWGFNGAGGLGDATGFMRTTPVPVHGEFNIGFLSNVKSIYASLTNNFAMQYDGTVLAWGANSRGQLGDNSTVNRNIPKRMLGAGGIGNMTNVEHINGGLFYTIVSKADGSVYTWGSKDNGQLGDSSTTDRLVPKQIGGFCGALALNPSVLQPTGCSGPCQGIATVIPVSGSAPFTYLWASGATTQNDSSLCAGTHLVTVTDINNNSSIATVVIPVNSSADAGVITSNKDTVCSGDVAQLLTSGSVGNLQWQSSTGSGFSNINTATTASYTTPAMTLTTTYRVLANDGNCADTSANFVLQVSVLTPPGVTQADTIICSSDSTLVQVSGTYASYNWNNGDNRNFTYVKVAGGYWATVTDANGCTAISGRANLAIYPVPSVSVVVQGDTLSSFDAQSYQWYRNGVLIPGATSATYRATQTGDYSVEITDDNGCKAQSNPITVTVIGINDISHNPLNIYPNPFSQRIFIDAGEIKSQVQSVEVYDMLGQLVYSRLTGLQSNTVEINLAGVASGMYMLKVKAADASYHQQVIKQ